MGIADFHFTPPSLTIHVGDTVTWTNQGPSPHTATATDGSFNTGVLNKGQSRSLTFRTPGTFTYTCQIHPFMHGTVVVLAVSTTPSSRPSAGTTSQDGQGTADTSASAIASHASSAAVTQPTLPATGTNTFLVVLTGLALGGVGLSLRLVLAR